MTAGAALDDDESPFDHFMDRGWRQGLTPHPLFNAGWYAMEYMGDAAGSVNPLQHYIEIGWRKGNRPHPVFWSDWYARESSLGDLRDGRVDPFYHYLTSGWRQQASPNPLFDTAFYRYTTGLSSDSEPLTHYIYGGHKHFRPHAIFVNEFFKANLARAGVKTEISPLEVYLSRSTINPCPLFDVEFVQEQFARLGLDTLGADLPPLIRYLEHAPVTIDPHPLFSRRHYLRRAPDTAELESLTHYMSSGWQEHRSAHPLFDPDHYIASIPGGLQGDPLQHYLETGFQEKRQPRPIRAPDTVTRILPTGRNVVTVSSTVSDVQAEAPAGRSIKVGVFAHVFHVDLVDDVIAATNNIRADCTVYVSTDEAVKAHQIEAAFRTASKHPVLIKVTPNHGRDIAPFLVGFRQEIAACDYGIHIHTKKSTHYGRQFDEWRKYLYRELLGSPQLVDNIIGLLRYDKVGAVFPTHYAPLETLLQWGGNFENLKSLLELAGEQLASSHILDFPSGSMFWFKSAAMATILGLNLRLYHFDPEAGQVDGTLAHAIERGLCYFVESAGFEWIATRSTSEASSAPTHVVNGKRELAYSTNRIFPTDWELGVERRYYPECTRFLMRPTPVEKPRLNLLIPTVERDKAYAGVATAFDIFNGLADCLRTSFDARLISTDSTPSNRYAPPAGYILADPMVQDRPGSNVVTDAAQRWRVPFTVRDNDIFMSTAWWTARNAIDIMAQQNTLFGTKARKMIYLVQDFECGFYAWSTKYALAQQTYLAREQTIPVFNTQILFDFFRREGYYQDGFVLNPPLNPAIRRYVKNGTPKEKIVLLYARPHADRNCLPFLDMLVATLTRRNPAFWAEWKFCAIGEDFADGQLHCTDAITIVGRLTLDEYGDLASRAALGISLMVSPHPSYPPLEMADAGVLTLTNTYAEKDLSRLHTNIVSFTAFDLDAVAAQFEEMARRWEREPMAGWSGQARENWFFGGQSNLDSMCESLAVQVRNLVTARA